LSYIDNAQSFTTEVSVKDIPPIFGAIHICIYFIITYNDGSIIRLEMCDIAIHDSGSSQQNETNTLDVMKKDPVYCNPLTEINPISLSDKVIINVPSIQKLIIQQLLAFKNLLKKKDKKCHITYNRLRYIQSLLIPRNAHRPALLKKIGIPDVNRISEYIDNELNIYIMQSCQSGMNKSSICNTLMGDIQQRHLLELHRRQQQELEQWQRIQQQQAQQYTYQLAQQQSRRQQSRQQRSRHQQPSTTNNQNRKKRTQQVIQLAEAERQRRINNITRHKNSNNQNRKKSIQQVIQLAETERKRRMSDSNQFHTPTSSPFYTPSQSPKSVQSGRGRKTRKRR
jgi:hypothetical protein